MTESLLERDGEIASFRSLLDAAATGEGGVVLVEGEAGIGKTSLLTVFQNLADGRACEVLRSRGDELERDYAWGVVRQLYEPALRKMKTAERGAILSGVAARAAALVGLEEREIDGVQSPDSRFELNHGLYWLTANMAERAPLVLLIDDAHWSDSASLLFLHFLAARIEELSLLAVLSLRPAEPGSQRELLRHLSDLPATERLTPARLGEQATGVVMERVLGSPPDRELKKACHEVTAGNPFLLEELLGALTAEGGLTPERARRLGPSSISRSVLGRLGTLWPAALALARAVAILGDGAQLRHAAALADLDLASAGEAADGLAAARVLKEGRPLRYVHSVLRQAVYEDLTPARRSVCHLRAARALDGEGADVESVAVHLLTTEPGGNGWVVDRLQTAGRRALARGAPEEAVTLLARADSEPADAGERVSVLWELGQAELLAGHAGATDRLRGALAIATESDLRAQIALAFAAAAAASGAAVEAAEVLESVIEELPPAACEQALLLEGALVANSVTHRSLIDRAWRRLDRFDPEALGDSPGARVVLAWLGGRAMLRGDSCRRALELTRQALGEGRLLAEQLAHSQHYAIACGTLLFCDRLEEAHANYSAGIDDSRRRGSETGFAVCSCFRSWVALRLGRLVDAEADARRSVELSESSPLLAAIGRYALSGLIQALVLRGRLDDAELELRRIPPEQESLGLYEENLVRHARGMLRLAQGRCEAALEDLLAAGRASLEWRFVNASWLPWRSNLALVRHTLGDREAALAIAREELELAEAFGAQRAIGVALHALGVVTGGEEAIPILRTAVASLEATQARLDHASALLSLGSALRRGRHRAEAREPLLLSLDLAHRCGASPLVDRAQQELKVAGARPRRLVVSGTDSLTASERRVAELAAEGLSNPEIAQALFVTRKTVEAHLGHVYRKLGIHSRTGIKAELAAEA